jgi:tetratricopeptide (TPR) repeat protein
MALKALSSPSAAQFKEKRVRALNTAGFLQGLLGETTPARRLLEEAIAILRKSNDQASLAWSLQFLGLVLTSEGEYDLADEALQEGLEITRKLGGLYANNFLHFLGDIDLQKGDHTRAKKIYEESASILRAFGSKSFLAYPLRRLGYLALDQNDIPKAWEYFEESLILNREIGDKRALAACLTAMAALALRMGKPELAATLYGVVERNLDLLSIKLLTLDQIELDLIRSKLPSYLEEGIFSTSYAEGWGMNEEQVIERLHYFEGASGYEEAGG